MSDAPGSKELAIIDLIAHLTGQTRPMSDDAFWEPEYRRIYTTDMLVEGRHFDLAYFSPQDVGWKAAAVNISDIAGMGGQLKYLLISLGLPDSFDLAWVKAFYQGVSSACQQYGGVIVGGDTVGCDRLTLNVTAIGECPPDGTPGHRYGAQTGDYILATGFHGLSHIGLLSLQAGLPGYQVCKDAHLHPQPRIEEGLMLARRFTRYALMDSSDGLADALLKIAQASEKSLIIQPESVPVHPELLQYAEAHAWSEQQLWQAVLYGGEDFQLVATVPELDEEICRHFTVLGRVEAPQGPPGAWLHTGDGRRHALSLEKTYQHFRTSGHA